MFQRGYTEEGTGKAQVPASAVQTAMGAGTEDGATAAASDSHPADRTKI